MSSDSERYLDHNECVPETWTLELQSHGWLQGSAWSSLSQRSRGESSQQICRPRPMHVNGGSSGRELLNNVVGEPACNFGKDLLDWRGASQLQLGPPDCQGGLLLPDHRRASLLEGVQIADGVPTTGGDCGSFLGYQPREPKATATTEQTFYAVQAIRGFEETIRCNKRDRSERWTD